MAKAEPASSSSSYATSTTAMYNPLRVDKKKLSQETKREDMTIDLCVCSVVSSTRTYCTTCDDGAFAACNKNPFMSLSSPPLPLPLRLPIKRCPGEE